MRRASSVWTALSSITAPDGGVGWVMRPTKLPRAMGLPWVPYSPRTVEIFAVGDGGVEAAQVGGQIDLRPPEHLDHLDLLSTGPPPVLEVGLGRRGADDAARHRHRVDALAVDDDVVPDAGRS
jgi:hypothetical protein